MTIALRVTGEFVKIDTGGSVEAVLAICGTATLGVSNEVTVDCVFTTTSLIALWPLIVLAGEEPDELTSVNLDDNRFLLGGGVDCGVGVDADRWAPRMPASVLRPVRKPPSSPTLGEFEAAVDVEVLVRPKGPAGVFADPESDAPLV
jgi:hypothetical protein